MDPNQQPQNTGSFGAPAGGMTSALSQVMQQVQSGQYVPQQSQVTNSAVSAPQSGQPLPQGQNMAPSAPTMPPVSSGAQDATQSPSLPFDSSESKMLIGAIANRLKAGTAYHHAIAGVGQPTGTSGGI